MISDGTPCDGKLSCTVWGGGKGGDNIKASPIAIPHKLDRRGIYPQLHEARPKKGVRRYFGKPEYRGLPCGKCP